MSEQNFKQNKRFLPALLAGRISHFTSRIYPSLASCLLSRVWHRLLGFPLLAQVACFPALDTGCLFSRAWHRLLVFPLLAQVACFPALDTGCLFSSAWRRLLVFQCLATVACFPSLCTACMLLLQSWLAHAFVCFVHCFDCFLNAIDLCFRFERRLMLSFVQNGL